MVDFVIEDGEWEPFVSRREPTPQRQEAQRHARETARGEAQRAVEEGTALASVPLWLIEYPDDDALDWRRLAVYAANSDEVLRWASELFPGLSGVSIYGPYCQQAAA